MPRAEEDEDIVDRIARTKTTEPLTVEAMYEVIRIRRELARIMEASNKLRQALDLCMSENAKQR